MKRYRLDYLEGALYKTAVIRISFCKKYEILKVKSFLLKQWRAKGVAEGATAPGIHPEAFNNPILFLKKY